MNSMNKVSHEEKPKGLKEKLIRAVGEKLMKMSQNPRCHVLPIYEPELSKEMIDEMVKNQ